MRDTTDRRGHWEHMGDKQHRGLKGAPGTQVRQKSQGTQGTHGDTGHKETVTKFFKIQRPLWGPALELNRLPCVNKVLLYFTLL